MIAEPGNETNSDAALKIDKLNKNYGSLQALKDISFEVANREIVAILGPSGCGKSTLLNCIAGLETADSGQILWDNHSLEGIPPHQRGFGFMFQDYALFPHMNVFDNSAYGLRMEGLPKDKIRLEVAQILDLVGLSGFEKRDVINLSGGEQQRVALARSLVPHPELLMLDEPLGALDRTLRERLLGDLRSILRKQELTALYVTHDQDEAFSVADRVVILNDGQIAQIGTPEDIFHHPASTFVARFLGMGNILSGEIKIEKSGTVLSTELGSWPWMDASPGEISVLIRPDSVEIDRSKGGLKGKMIERSFRGSVCRALIDVQNHRFQFDFPSNKSLPHDGAEIFLTFEPHKALQIL
jgi:ABC-type Fe3+/spermidine/putrescine transport system ATPase subunit